MQSERCIVASVCQDKNNRQMFCEMPPEDDEDMVPYSDLALRVFAIVYCDCLLRLSAKTCHNHIR